MKQIIIYIHGFNSGPGQKSQDLKLAFPKAEVITPELDFNCDKAIKQLEIILEKHKEKEVHIVSTSLGGFYSLYLLTKYNSDNINYYLLNPSIDPVYNLKHNVNKTFTNLKTKKKNIFTIDNLKSFDKTKKYIESNIKPEYINNINFFFGDKDDIINHECLIEYLKSLNIPFSSKHENQDHRFSDITSVIEKIKENTLI